MLTRLIVDLYAWIIVIALWLMLVTSAVAGYHFAVPMLSEAGWIIENEALWKLCGAVFFAAATFLLSLVVVGPVVVLVDIRKSVRALEKQSMGSGMLEKERLVHPPNPFR